MTNAFIDIIFDGPPGPTCGRFVEVENSEGNSISVGEWIERADGYWVLRLNPAKEIEKDALTLHRTPEDASSKDYPDRHIIATPPAAQTDGVRDQIAEIIEPGIFAHDDTGSMIEFMGKTRRDAALVKADRILALPRPARQSEEN